MTHKIFISAGFDKPETLIEVDDVGYQKVLDAKLLTRKHDVDLPFTINGVRHDVWSTFVHLIQ